MVSQDGLQSGMSLSKALCIDKDVTGQEQTLNVTDCRKSATVEVKEKLCLEKDNDCSEFKSLNNFLLVVDESLETEKICIEETEGLGLHIDVPLETQSDKAPFNGISNEIDHKKTCNTDVSESKPFKQQFKLLPADLENAAEKEITNHDQTKTRLDSLLDSKLNLDRCKKYSLQGSSNAMLDKCQKIKQTLREESECSIAPFSCYQQTSKAAQKPEATVAHAMVVSPPCPSAVSGESLKGLKNSENSNTMPTLVKPVLSPTERTIRKNMNNTQNSPFKNHLTSSESSVNISNSQANSHASQGNDLKSVVPMTSSTEKQLSSENQITEATKSGLFSLVDVKTRQCMLLSSREKAEANDILSEGTFSEGQLEESHLSHVTPSADSVNTSARSAFDLPTPDKKLKKTAGYMKFVAVSPWSKINQIKSKTVGTSPSSFPSLPKEEPVGPESKVITQVTLCENVGMDDTSKNIEPGKKTWPCLNSVPPSSTT
ncbi:hypothetical protein HispidOSU_019918 [Sigmodon hispidus]